MVTQTQGWRCTFNLVLLFLVSFGSRVFSEEIYLGRRPIDSSSQLSARGVSVGCSDASFNVRLVAVCPSGNQDEEGLYFEEASRPVLSVEAQLTEGPEGKDSDSGQLPLIASTGPDESLVKPKGIAFIGLTNVNLINENLFQEGRSSEINLDYGLLNSELTQIARRGHTPKIQIQISVCQDAAGTGKCSDKDPKNVLTLRSHIYGACEIPKEVPIAVWAGCR